MLVVELIKGRFSAAEKLDTYNTSETNVPPKNEGTLGDSVLNSSRTVKVKAPVVFEV